jgi:hypothetical protein
MSTPPVVDVPGNTVTYEGLSFVMRPLSADSYTIVVDGEVAGRAVYTFGTANAVVEGGKVSEEVLTAVAEAWFAAVDG